MANLPAEWEIVGLLGECCSEGCPQPDFDSNTSIKGLEAYLLDPERLWNDTEDETRQATHTLTRSWVCKLYILAGVTGHDLSVCMGYLEDAVLSSPKLSHSNRVFCHLKHLPELLSLPLLRCNPDEAARREETAHQTRDLISSCLAHLLSDRGGKPNIILIAGTSGSGKSTISSYLASFLRVKCVVSTDTIRHVLRTTERFSDNKALNCSTYEVHKYIDVDSAREDEYEASPKSPIVLGYLLQSSIIEDYIYEIITSLARMEKSIIVEGVHITPSLFERVQSFAYSNNANLSAFLIYIQDPDEHILRFQQRSKGVLSSKYHSNILNIREIQSYLKNTIGELPPVTSIDNTSNDIDNIVQEKILKEITNKFT
ncbi:phosphoglycerate kinase-like protein [Cryptosporidium canis]|uniref:Phosphoglycerate kinase-like protein n=1 Tax=Cryptosporidium canis TaxID=195482 RepID=A0ABQ8P5G0_9CRYT|nr:phosphoglycerate kinase-like protein [Cryptosporidium canis]